MAAEARRRRKHLPLVLLGGLLILGLAAVGSYQFLVPPRVQKGPPLVFQPGEADLPDVPWKALSLSPDGEFLAVELAGQSLATRQIALLDLEKKALAGLISGPTGARSAEGETSAPVGPMWLEEPGATAWLVLEGCRIDETVTGYGSFEIGAVGSFPGSRSSSLWELSIASGESVRRLSLPAGIVWPMRVMGARVGFSLGIGNTSYGVLEWPGPRYQSAQGVSAENRVLASLYLPGGSPVAILLAFPDRLGLISTGDMKMRMLGSLASLDGNPDRSVPRQRCLYGYEAERIGSLGTRVVFPITVQEGARGGIFHEVWFLDFDTTETGVLWRDSASSGFVSGSGQKIGFKRALGTTYSRFRVGSVGIVTEGGPVKLFAGFPPQSVFAEFRNEDEIICVLEESCQVWSLKTDGSDRERLYP